MENKLFLIFKDLQVLNSGQREINQGMLTFRKSVDATREKVDEVISVTNSNVSFLKLPRST